jgi:Sulfotransferase family
LRQAFLRRPGAPPLVAFVHIPKTAGGTVTSMFTAAYSPQSVRNAGNYVRNPEKAIAKLESHRALRQLAGGRVAVGHVPYGLFRPYLPANTRYMTFLREPVDRVLSHYYRHVHRQDPRRAGSAKERQSRKVKAASLEEALVEMRLARLSDLATRFLCGDPSPMGELPATALEDAKENLRDFAFVGIQERFDESLALLQRTFDLDAVPRDAYVDRHVSIAGARPSVEEIPSEQRELILEYNRFDAELYRFGLELFERALEAGAERQ